MVQPPKTWQQAAKRKRFFRRNSDGAGVMATASYGKAEKTLDLRTGKFLEHDPRRLPEEDLGRAPIKSEGGIILLEYPYLSDFLNVASADDTQNILRAQLRAYIRNTQGEIAMLRQNWEIENSVRWFATYLAAACVIFCIFIIVVTK